MRSPERPGRISFYGFSIVIHGDWSSQNAGALACNTGYVSVARSARWFLCDWMLAPRSSSEPTRVQFVLAHYLPEWERARAPLSRGMLDCARISRSSSVRAALATRPPLSNGDFAGHVRPAEAMCRLEISDFSESAPSGPAPTDARPGEPSLAAEACFWSVLVGPCVEVGHGDFGRASGGPDRWRHRAPMPLRCEVSLHVGAGMSERKRLSVH